MTTANPLTPKVIAALLVIGDKILSGRTKDKNIGYIAEYLTALGINLREVRVVGDEGTAIVDALNALRHRYTYVFTTGGIGPAPDDITSDCVAKAFGVPIDVDPRSLAILHEWLKATGAEMSDARMRMTRIPKGADLVLNEVSGAPGFWIGNVIVLAGVPSIMQAMLDQVGPQAQDRHAPALGNCPRRCARERYRYPARRDRESQSRSGNRQPSVLRFRSMGPPILMWCCAPATHKISSEPKLQRVQGAQSSST
jgi:molybdenum cofactor synthesis domain-containing protein